jgi:hypothetical protein
MGIKCFRIEALVHPGRSDGTRESPRHVTAHAQLQSRTFAELGGGAITQESQFNVRSGVGATAAFAVGRALSEQLTLEGRLSASAFAAPQQITNPGGCLGRSPCVFPSASNVRVVTLGASGEYHSTPTPIMPLVLFGLGGRYVSEAPERGSDARPYGEVGVGLMLHHWGLRARYQATTAGSELPKWMIPVTLDYRF